jgi:hypothetical protein
MLASVLLAARVTLPAPDAALSTTDGRATHLAERRGSPAVLFYESRSATELNAHVKARLAEEGARDDLRHAVRVIPIANLARYNFAPARDIALAFLRRLERRLDVTILVDLDGALAAPPWSLPPDTSSVVLLDAGGAPVWRRSGRLSDDDMEALFTRLGALLGRESPTP